MAFWALLAEYRAIKAYQILHPSELVETNFEDARSHYKNDPVVFTSISFILIAAGMLISGYGDLPFSG